MFYFDSICNKKVLKSDLLSEVEHFFTTRELCMFSKTEDMSENVKRVENYLGCKLATNLPVHGVNIEKIIDDKFYYKETDGLIIEKNRAGYMSFGDCTPIIFYCGNVAMISHAGWRGTVQNMAKFSVQKIINEYGFKVKDIKAVVGPAICKKCYNVSKDVYDDLYKTVEYNKKDLFEIRNNEYFVDLKGINKQQLLEVGIEQIDVCPYCTACGEKLFFSYRYENHTGYRHSAVVKV